MSRGGPRMRRVNEILRETIADECADLKDPRIGFLTITEVDTAPDLRRATVFYSVLGDEAEHKSTAEALASAAPRIRTAVGAQIRMKYLPELKFEVDPSIEYGLKISSILANLEKEPVGDDPE